MHGSGFGRTVTLPAPRRSTGHVYQVGTNRNDQESHEAATSVESSVLPPPALLRLMQTTPMHGNPSLFGADGMTDDDDDALDEEDEELLNSGLLGHHRSASAPAVHQPFQPSSHAVPQSVESVRGVFHDAPIPPSAPSAQRKIGSNKTIAEPADSKEKHREVDRARRKKMTTMLEDLRMLLAHRLDPKKSNQCNIILASKQEIESLRRENERLRSQVRVSMPSGMSGVSSVSSPHLPVGTWYGGS